MTHRSRWLRGACFLAAALGGGGACSSSSAGTHDGGDGGDDRDVASSSGDGGAPIADATPSTTCDAASLAPLVDAGAAACFVCQAAHCMQPIAECAIDCACAAAYTCLQQNSTGGSLNSGYSACGEAVDALMNGNAALTDVAGCTTNSCHDECFGDGG
jgi:hypothetical protein